MTESKALIKEIKQITPTIRWYLFKALNRDFHFLPGQWIDLRPEGLPAWGGYSIMGPPSDLPYFELAVRRPKNHLVTKWLYQEAKVGHSVDIKGGGGSCFYSPQDHDQTVLIMGGIGLTPLMSMARTFNEKSSLTQARMKIFYSVKNLQEWGFKDLFSKLNQDKRIQIETFFSQEKGRMDVEVLKETFERPQYFICGPPQMIEGLSKSLLKSGIPRKKIHFEKWW